jgi:hypothetical protein
MKVTKIPLSMEKETKYTAGIANNTAYFNKFTSSILDLKNTVKNDSLIKTTIVVFLLKMCRS